MNIKKAMEEMSEEIAKLTGVSAITMSGSRANGPNHLSTDMDIAIYYDKTKGFNVEDVNNLVSSLDDNQSAECTSLNEWGALMNGGASLTIHGVCIAIIFRDIHKVVDGITANLQGEKNKDRNARPPYVYLDVLYLGELAICEILYDPYQYIYQLKQKITHYPEQLHQALIEYYTFEASYSFMIISHRIDTDDDCFVASHVLRTIRCMNQLLFTINRACCIHKYNAVQSIDVYSTRPDNYGEKVNDILQSLVTTRKSRAKGMQALHDLLSSTEELAAV
ncbi:hypothetical protein J5S49_09760 [Virgibacillus halodenitrificans]|uniref:nucleotidyltransferase domain-containing protein n=1 Tax=Virgibacillus halodenitrificans TaxID=1482 RepID=UPI001F416A55|nr:nucleotidyltransferase domain-containing protein [Virgibacillus halodenitrificans]MCG1028578.1 hypothetical protein [Virgibacillus halodenitrificans]